MSAERADRYGVVPIELAKSLSGLQLLIGIMKGALPEPPIQQALDFRLVQVERGYTAFAGSPKFNYYNPLGSVPRRIYRRSARFLHGLRGALDT